MPLSGGGGWAERPNSIPSGILMHPASTQFYVSYLAFDDLSHHLCISRWSLPWSYHDWTTVMRLPTSLLNRLQSVINAAARSIAGLRCSEHITDALASFHWLRAPERIKFKLAVLVYRALHSTAPQYLSGQLQYVANLRSRCRGRLHSSTSSLLDVRPSRLVTVRDRSFAAAGPRLWNSLPVDVQSAPSLTTFRRKLKTHLFRQSYPDIVFLTASP